MTLSDDLPGWLRGLTTKQGSLVKRCIEAAVHGPFFSCDLEFFGVIGFYRGELEAMLGTWEHPSAYPDALATKKDCLRAAYCVVANLCDFPHRRDAALPEPKVTLRALQDRLRGLLDRPA